ncbi:hypothetical protein COCC4DRAFT_200205 [Bipolaris maydis ATCC 48331]|uniref:Uncharacterized protein n=2 Tax=Cochliobolus heterostrophus TaxID=5016 RepID=M2U1L4_COCH5|nr:uncharacterized protein COCC4DRAFT_200205 [Bipolaris maydis ATCC 48331]EMD87921.1 hypothetical protein COCHEDRAFT_1143643 [Bipolaris maydis C5]ENI03436.1 hypothetical protein COCC4DRAFT_200205 [Bipolaris maydis ATCC 48331]
MFVDHNVQLCRRLGDEECEVCMGIVSHDDEAFHLHPVNQKRNQPENGPITLGHVLSRDFQDPFSRRQRYQIALLVASSVAQLQSTPWLRTGLCKEDVIFFPSEERNELLPHPPNADAATKHAFDVMAGLKWSRSVSDESGEDYATAVKWCFTGVTDKEKNWRGEIVRNVIQPLEKCMEHFNNVTVAV